MLRKTFFHRYTRTLCKQTVKNQHFLGNKRHCHSTTRTAHSARRSDTFWATTCRNNVTISCCISSDDMTLETKWKPFMLYDCCLFTLALLHRLGVLLCKISQTENPDSRTAASSSREGIINVSGQRAQVATASSWQPDLTFREEIRGWLTSRVCVCVCVCVHNSCSRKPMTVFSLQIWHRGITSEGVNESELVYESELVCVCVRVRVCTHQKMNCRPGGLCLSGSQTEMISHHSNPHPLRHTHTHTHTHTQLPLFAIHLPCPPSMLYFPASVRHVSPSSYPSCFRLVSVLFLTFVSQWRQQVRVTLFAMDVGLSPHQAQNTERKGNSSGHKRK